MMCMIDRIFTNFKLLSIVTKRTVYHTFVYLCTGSVVEYMEYQSTSLRVDYIVLYYTRLV